MRRPRILVADDEPLITGWITRALNRDHDVVCVADGADVVRLASRGERFDVILLDLSMAKIGGALAYWELATIAPDQARRVVFLTGGAVTEADRRFLESVVQPTLEKPVGIAELRFAVDGMLAHGERISADLQVDDAGWRVRASTSMQQIDETWARQAVQLSDGQWITIAIQQQAEGWHYAWWWRRDATEDLVGTTVHGASVLPFSSNEVARRAGIVDAEAEARRGAGPQG